MAMKTLRKAYFFKEWEDKARRHAYILYYMMGEDTGRRYFKIFTPTLDGGTSDTTIALSLYCNPDDFNNMVAVMKAMIQPVEVVVE
ncbi:MAG: hypothetical protein IJ709_04270 [Selenomonas sp.]|nr:hypothetical protein [Selenomonas sp.]